MLYHVVEHQGQAYLVPEPWWQQIVKLQEMPFELVNRLFQQVELAGSIVPPFFSNGVDYSQGTTEVVEDFLQDMGISWQS